MKNILQTAIFILLLNTSLSITVMSQVSRDSARSSDPFKPGKNTLFGTDEILPVSLQGDINALLKDRSDNEQYHPVSLSYMSTEGQPVNLSTQLKTRGHFRKLKENCNYPPLTIKFPGNELQNKSIFKGQEKLKLVVPCRNDKYIINEWMVYRIYNLVTAKSFNTRLLSITLLDENNQQLKLPFYAFLIEDEKQMALRNKLIAVEHKLLPEQTNADAFLIMAVFEYLVANTDWSTQFLQNIKLVAADSNTVPIAVPYDFDHAGIVEAPYAQPFEALKMRSIRERRYRGYCLTDLSKFKPVLALFNQLKTEIYNLYTNCTLLDERYKKRTLKYLDDFYRTINNTKTWQKDFSYPCDKNGTGNVVVKGLKE